MKDPNPARDNAPGTPADEVQASFILLDLSGLRCPLPIVKLNGAIRELAPGAGLEVRATDPAFELDIQAWCRRTGNPLLDLQKGTGVLVARLRKAG